VPDHRKSGKRTAESEEKEIEARTSPGGHIIYEAVHQEGLDELARSNQSLAWSGLAAGLSMGFSLLGEGILRSHLPDTPIRPLIAKFGYCLGFLVVVLGRQQLFTENTLTVILPLLRKKTGRMFADVARLWSIVLASNLVGTFLIAWVIGNTSVVAPAVQATMTEVGHLSMGYDFLTLMMKGIFAGWLIALMVWLMPFAEAARVWVIIIITYFVGLGEFSHIVAGSVDAFYLVGRGEKTILEYFLYMFPILIGNVIGGSSIVAAISHAQHIMERTGKPA
jgi:formate/nitrite transporter FocA (FNT family)